MRADALCRQGGEFGPYLQCMTLDQTVDTEPSNLLTRAVEEDGLVEWPLTNYLIGP
jgi:hypothetical protein